MARRYLFPTLMAIVAFSSFAKDRSAELYSILEAQYAEDVRRARQTLDHPERPSGYERYILVFGLDAFNRTERIGRILVAAREQEMLAQRYFERQTGEPAVEPFPSNQLIVDAALATLQARIKLSCRECSSADELRQFRRTVDAYFDLFSIRDAHRGFSGLPFTQIMQTRFFDPTFQTQTVQFHARLVEQLELIAKKPGQPLKENIWTLALQTTDGNEAVAIELLGLLMSRDVLITRYLKYLRLKNPNFTRAFVMAPLLTRLITELDRNARNDSHHFFSYDGKFSTNDDRLYYFWSAALAAKHLKEAGYLDRFIKTVSLEFSRQYKIIRYFEALGFFKDEEFHSRFRSNSTRALLITAKGARIGLQAVTQATQVSTVAPEVSPQPLSGQSNGEWVCEDLLGVQ